MVDIETLGTDPGCLILSIGAVAFDEHGTNNKFYVDIDALSSLLAGFTVDTRTVKWWNQQSKEALDLIKPGPDTLTIKHALDRLSGFINKDDIVWAKGPDFDLVILKAAYDKLGIRLPWSFRNSRDVRTMLWLGKKRDVALSPKQSWMVDHYALHDAIYQATQVIEVCSGLGMTLT